MKPVLAFCLFKYFPFGGLQRDFYRIAEECQCRGYGVRVFTLSWDGEIPEGFDVRIAPLRACRNHTRVKKYADWVLDAVRAEPVAGVIGLNKIPGLDVYYAADSCYKEKSLTQRGPFYRLGSRYRLYAAFESAVFGTYDKPKILMISTKQERAYRKYYGTQRERIYFLPPNIHRDRVAPPNAAELRADFRQANGFTDADRLLVQIGSGFIKKGVDRSIRALASLPLEIRGKTTLWVVGRDKPDRFLRLARRLGIAAQVVFTGARSDIPKILLGADLMIHPAYDENTGTALLEAVAAGLPVLCSEVCGYGNHIKAADCGLLTPEPFKQEMLNQQLLHMLTGSDLSALGDKALSYARSTDIYSMHIHAVNIIEQIMDGSK